MSIEPVRLTREQAYEIVWARPIQQLAAEWGLSDVGLAKILKGMSIPRPGRGYWARLAAGQKPKRTALPRIADGDQRTLLVSRSPLADRPKREPFVVAVADKLTDPHDVVRWLLAAVPKSDTDEYGRTRASAGSFVVGPKDTDRALRILDAVLKALVALGHSVSVGKRHPWSNTEEIVVQAEDRGVSLQIEEGLRTEPHQLTRQEKQEKARSPWMKFATHDYVPDRKLWLRIRHESFSYRKRKWWHDEDDRSLEEQLDRAVLAIDEVVHIAIAEARHAKEQHRLRIIQERKQLRAERLEWYAHWLTDDLDEMISRWEHAGRIRRFVAEYERRISGQAEDERRAAWRLAVNDYADQLDPMCRPERIAKEMEPSDETLERLIADAEKAKRR